MTIILWIMLGGFAGWIASLFMRTENTYVEDIVLGMAGGFVGGFIMNSLGISGISGLNLYSFALAITGAVGLIFVGRLLHR